MREVGVRELKQNISEVLRSVRVRKETVAVAYRGRTIARIVPVEEASDAPEWLADAWVKDMDQLAKEISAHWPKNVTAVQAVREQRREL